MNFADKDIFFNLEHFVDLPRIESTKKEPLDLDFAKAMYETVDSISETLEKNAPILDRKEHYTIDKDNNLVFPPAAKENLELFIQNGLICPSIPTEFGGLGLPKSVALANLLRLMRADSGFLTIPGLTDASALMLYHHGTPEQHQRHLHDMAAGKTLGCMVLTEPNAGSDVGNVKTTSVYEDGTLRVDGSKIFITNGAAQKHFVLVRNPTQTGEGTKGISMALVERTEDGNRNGVYLDRLEEKLGIHSSPTLGISYTDSQGELVGEEGKGFKIMLQMMNDARLAAGVQGLAISDAALLNALDYAKERKQFGRSILEYALVDNMLFSALAKTHMMRAMTFDLANSLDLCSMLETQVKNVPSLLHKGQSKEKREFKKNKNKATTLTSMFKYYATEAAQTITKDCLQVCGGNGYIEENPLARFSRDARITTIYEGTSEIQASYCLMSQIQWEFKKKGHDIKAVLEEIVESMDEIKDAPLRKLAGHVKNGVKKVYAAHSSLIGSYKTALGVGLSVQGIKTVVGAIRGKRPSDEKQKDAFNVISTRAKEYCDMIMEVYGSSLLVRQAQFSPEKQKIAELYIQEHMRPRVDYCLERVRDISSERVGSIRALL